MPDTAQPRSFYRCFVPYPDAKVRHAPDGPLSGLSFGVKDLFDVEGYPTGCGNPHMLALSGVKGVNATAVNMLLNAGARFVGKTHTDELAFSMTGKNVHFGIPVNGAAPDRVCGGSSSGSASAVSNRLCSFAIGTDTGGSVRAPSSHCGLYGLRPTHGGVSLEGCMPLSPSLDACGWFARDAKTLSLVGGTLLGADSSTLSTPRDIVVPLEFESELRPHTAAVFFDTLARVAARLGANVYRKRISTHSVDALCDAFRHIQGFEAWRGLGHLLDEHHFQLGETVRDRFDWSRGVTSAQYETASETRAKFDNGLANLLDDNTVIAVPSMPDVAPLISVTDSELDAYRFEAIRLLCVSGLSGCPQVSMPIMQIQGIPLGFSLLGPRGSDTALLSLAVTIAG